MFYYLSSVVIFCLFPHDKIVYMQEVGHFLAAFPKKVRLSIPYFIPNITLGSFGAITQVSIINYFCMSVPGLKTLSSRNFFFWGLKTIYEHGFHPSFYFILLVRMLQYILYDWAWYTNEMQASSCSPFLQILE